MARRVVTRIRFARRRPVAIVTFQDLKDIAMIHNIEKISLEENLESVTAIITAQCKKGQKWKKRKHARFKRDIKKRKMACVLYIYNGLEVK